MTRPEGPAIRFRRRSVGSRSGVYSGVISTGGIELLGSGRTSSAQGAEEGLGVEGRVREVEAQHGPAVLLEDGGIARGLGLDELAEAERAIRDLEVGCRVGGDLEDTPV